MRAEDIARQSQESLDSARELANLLVSKRPKGVAIMAAAVLMARDFFIQELDSLEPGRKLTRVEMAMLLELLAEHIAVASRDDEGGFRVLVEAAGAAFTNMAKEEPNDD